MDHTFYRSQHSKNVKIAEFTESSNEKSIIKKKDTLSQKSEFDKEGAKNMRRLIR